MFLVHKEMALLRSHYSLLLLEGGLGRIQVEGCGGVSQDLGMVGHVLVLKHS